MAQYSTASKLWQAQITWLCFYLSQSQADMFISHHCHQRTFFSKRIFGTKIFWKKDHIMCIALYFSLWILGYLYPKPKMKSKWIIFFSPNHIFLPSAFHEEVLRYLTFPPGKYSVLKFRFQVLFVVNWVNAHSFIRILFTQRLDPIETFCLSLRYQTVLDDGPWILPLSSVHNAASLSHFLRGKNIISSVHFYKAGARPTRIVKVVDGKQVRALLLEINNHVPPDSNDVMKHWVRYLHWHNNWEFKLCKSVDEYWQWLKLNSVERLCVFAFETMRECPQTHIERVCLAAMASCDIFWKLFNSQLEK